MTSLIIAFRDHLVSPNYLPGGYKNVTQKLEHSYIILNEIFHSSLNLGWYKTKEVSFVDDFAILKFSFDEIFLKKTLKRISANLNIIILQFIIDVNLAIII